MTSFRVRFRLHVRNSWLPIGFGKSVCYEELLFIIVYKLIVNQVNTVHVIVLFWRYVSPLILLMVDQGIELETEGSGCFYYFLWS